jgi:hypothetical protein
MAIAGPGAVYSVYLIDTVSGAVFSVGAGDISAILQGDASIFASANAATAYWSGSHQVTVQVPASMLTGSRLFRVMLTYLISN